MLAKKVGRTAVFSLLVFISSNVMANEELRVALEAAVDQATQAQVAKAVEEAVVKKEGKGTAANSAPSASTQNKLQNAVSDAVADMPATTSGSVEGATGAKGLTIPEKMKTKSEKTPQKSSVKSSEPKVASMIETDATKSTRSATRTVANPQRSDKTTVTSQSRSTTPPVSRKPINNIDSRKKDEGWMYLGRFFEENWTDKALKIDNKLPKSGEAYKVGISTNVRASYPGQDGKKKVVKVLDDRYQVKVLDVRRVGRDHHYWALVKWLR